MNKQIIKDIILLSDNNYKKSDLEKMKPNELYEIYNDLRFSESNVETSSIKFSFIITILLFFLIFFIKPTNAQGIKDNKPESRTVIISMIILTILWLIIGYIIKLTHLFLANTMTGINDMVQEIIKNDYNNILNNNLIIPNVDYIIVTYPMRCVNRFNDLVTTTSHVGLLIRIDGKLFILHLSMDGIEIMDLRIGRFKALISPNLIFGTLNQLTILQNNHKSCYSFVVDVLNESRLDPNNKRICYPPIIKWYHKLFDFIILNNNVMLLIILVIILINMIN